MTYGPARAAGNSSSRGKACHTPLCRGDLLRTRSQRSSQRRRLFDPHEGAVARSEQKVGIHKRLQQHFADVVIEAPQPPRLRFSESQTWHLEKFTLHAPERLLNAMRRLRRHDSFLRRSADLPGSSGEAREQWVYQPLIET